MTPPKEKKGRGGPNQIREFLDLSNIPASAPESLPTPRPQNLGQSVPAVEMTENNLTNELLRPSPENRQIASFLGGNPETILKNMEIARRTG